MIAFKWHNLLQAERLNGITQEQFVVTNPTCFPGLDAPLTHACHGAAGPSGCRFYDLSNRSHTGRALHGAKRADRSVEWKLHEGGDANSQLLELARLLRVPHNQRECAISWNVLVIPMACHPSAIFIVTSQKPILQQNQLMVISNVRVGSKVHMFGYYSL